MRNNNLTVHYIAIPTDHSGQRVDNFLRTYLRDVPKGAIYRIIRRGEVRINGKKVKPEYKLHKEDIIRIPPVWFSLKKQHASSCTQYMQFSLLRDSVLYEDDSLLVINKPSGIAVHGGSGLRFGIIEGLRLLRPHAKFLELVHRLDRYTSGVLLIAKKRSVLRILHKQLCDKKMRKEYLALVHGCWQSHIKTVVAPLLRRTYYTREQLTRVSDFGKPSETLFKIKERFSIVTLMRVIPLTGRTHQIRVHAQYAGCPVVCDKLYGNSTLDQKLTKIGIDRMFLHASSLRFIHPDKGKVMLVTAPLDCKIDQCISYLRSNYQISV